MVDIKKDHRIILNNINTYYKSYYDRLTPWQKKKMKIWCFVADIQLSIKTKVNNSFLRRKRSNSQDFAIQCLEPLRLLGSGKRKVEQQSKVNQM